MFLNDIHYLVASLKCPCNILSFPSVKELTLLFQGSRDNHLYQTRKNSLFDRIAPINSQFFLNSIKYFQIYFVLYTYDKLTFCV